MSLTKKLAHVHDRGHHARMGRTLMITKTLTVTITKGDGDASHVQAKIAVSLPQDIVESLWQTICDALSDIDFKDVDIGGS